MQVIHEMMRIGSSFEGSLALLIARCILSAQLKRQNETVGLCLLVIVLVIDKSSTHIHVSAWNRVRCAEIDMFFSKVWIGTYSFVVGIIKLVDSVLYCILRSFGINISYPHFHMSANHRNTNHRATETLIEDCWASRIYSISKFYSRQSILYLSKTHNQI